MAGCLTALPQLLNLSQIFKKRMKRKRTKESLKATNNKSKNQTFNL